MPLYEYLCDECGPFTAVRAMAEFALPHVCDACGAEAPRAILSAPALSGIEPGRRRAHEVNERSCPPPGWTCTTTSPTWTRAI